MIWRESAGVEPGGVTQARKDDWSETDVQPTSLTLEAMRWPLFRHTGERPGQNRPGLGTYVQESAGPELKSPQGILLEQSCTLLLKCVCVCVCVCARARVYIKKKSKA